MLSIVSYPERGNYGNNRYRGNCSGKLIEDIIDQYRLEGLSDFMVGSGTTEDVIRSRGLRGDFADLNRGFDMLSMDIPERAENIFWHPPYHDMIQYSDSMYSSRQVESMFGLSAETIAAHDLSRCRSWEEFIEAMNYCMMKQFSALEKGGRMFTLMGDMKRRGVLYSMLADCAKIGTLEQIIIKQQHNCVSDGRQYSGRFVPIVHEYLMVTRKDSDLIIPVATTIRQQVDLRDCPSASWRDILLSVLNEHGECSLEQLYGLMNGRAKTRTNQHWQEKIRQTLQNNKYFMRKSRGVYMAA